MKIAQDLQEEWIIRNTIHSLIRLLEDRFLQFSSKYLLRTHSIVGGTQSIKDGRGLYRFTKKITLQRLVFQIYYYRNSKKALHYSREKLAKSMDKKTHNRKESSLSARQILYLMDFKFARRNQLISNKTKQKRNSNSPFVATTMAIAIMLLNRNVEQATAVMFH